MPKNNQLSQAGRSFFSNMRAEVGDSIVTQERIKSIEIQASDNS